MTLHPMRNANDAKITPQAEEQMQSGAAGFVWMCPTCKVIFTLEEEFVHVGKIVYCSKECAQ